MNYTYDGDGRRVKKDNGTLYWYGTGGEVLSETALDGSSPADYIYFDGRRLARVAGGTAYYYLEDHLGSARLLVQAGQNAACYDADFEPYGREHIITNSCPQHYKFASMEQDGETGMNASGNYHTQARQYPPNLGRWLSPDPGGINVVHLDDPQTWNMYAYVRNSPTTLADPTGLGEEPPGFYPGTKSGTGTVADTKDCRAKQGTCARKDDKPGIAYLPAQMSSLQFFGQELGGVWDSTGGAVLGLGASVLSGEAEKNVATTAEWAVTSPGRIGEAVKEAGHEAAQTLESAASGNPRAIGQVVGTVATVAYAANNLRIDAYKSGGGGINLVDTPTTNSRIGLDYNAFKGSNGPQLHVDITIKKPAAPFGPGASGPGSNLINIRHWTPW